ncbi:MAG: PDZ domain-containing protein [Gemmatimonadetes bacterium]|nr:PDZ domain-containing protein [Gemmatimonadota bacterium]
MRSTFRWLSAGALGLAIPFVAPRAQAVAQSAPISGIRYDVTFDSRTAPARTLRVGMTFDVGGPGTVLLSLPAWTPGAYEISNFARWVSNFSAAAGEKALTWDKLDYDTWRIRPDGAKSITVTFDYLADSLDNAMTWSRGNFAFFNGTNVFLYPEGRPTDFTATVTVKTEPSWLVTTGMKPAGAARTYSASNYHDLVDMPFFIGEYDVDSTQIVNKWVRMASWPKGALQGANRTTFWDHQKKMIPAMGAVFNDIPWDNYTTFIVFDSTSGGGSALEHQSSHLGIYTPLLVESILFPSITAHEMIHAWNVKRLRPADMVPYKYSQPEPTPWLWVSEGITDYYSDVVLARSGVTDTAGFLILTQGKIEETDATPPVALTDASLSTWIHPTDGTGYIYYQKGSLAGLLLDIMIRDASDNKKGLDDVFRELYQTAYKQKWTGFTSEQWWGAVSRAAGGKSFDEFNAKYVDGREPMPFATVLPLGGFRLKVDTIREPRLGVTSAPDSSGVRVAEVQPGSPAEAAGLRPGDYLDQVGDIAVRDPSFGEQFRNRYAKAEGTKVPVKVRRGGQSLDLQIEVRLAERTERRLMIDPAASAKAVRIRNGILKGVGT